MIDGLRKNPISLLPDFPQGGIADCTDYNGGVGVEVRVVPVSSKETFNKIMEIPWYDYDQFDWFHFVSQWELKLPK